MNKRFHSHKNGTAWKQEVRYFFYTLTKNVMMFDGVNPEGLWCRVEDKGVLIAQYRNGWVLSGGHKGSNITECRHMIEVQESDLPYLVKPEGDWEFRNPFEGEIIYANGCEQKAFEDFTDECVSGGRGYRWCKPRKVDAFEEWWDNEGNSINGNRKKFAREAWNAAKEL